MMMIYRTRIVTRSHEVDAMRRQRQQCDTQSPPLIVMEQNPVIASLRLQGSQTPTAIQGFEEVD